MEQSDDVNIAGAVTSRGRAHAKTNLSPTASLCFVKAKRSQRRTLL